MGAGSFCARNLRTGRRWIGWSFLFLAAVSGGLYVRWRSDRLIARLTTDIERPIDQSGGVLVIVGGGMVTHPIKERFWRYAGGNDSRIVIIPASEMTPEQLKSSEERWEEFKTASLSVLHAESRTQADDPEFSRQLESATGVWLCGGAQTWLAGMYRGTLVQERLVRLLARGGVIGGTSAGAAVMSDVMLAGGRKEPIEGRGFAFVRDAVIDQHFLKRNRLTRLMKLLDQHPGLVGLGVDERTALIVELKDHRLSVVGDSYVMACVPGMEGRPPRFEFLKPGDQTDLTSLRIPEISVESRWDLDAVLMGED
jgi:cyanophycinase